MILILLEFASDNDHLRHRCDPAVVFTGLSATGRQPD
jgi:hypothetical protein